MCVVRTDGHTECICGNDFSGPRCGGKNDNYFVVTDGPKGIFVCLENDFKIVISSGKLSGILTISLSLNVSAVYRNFELLCYSKNNFFISLTRMQSL